MSHITNCEKKYSGEFFKSFVDLALQICMQKSMGLFRFTFLLQSYE